MTQANLLFIAHQYAIKELELKHKYRMKELRLELKIQEEVKKNINREYVLR